MEKAKAKKGKPDQRQTNVWKLVSIVFITLFCVTVALSFLRHHSIRPGFIEATAEQKERAEGIVAQDLESRRENIAEYEKAVATKIRGIVSGNMTRHIIQVSLWKGSARYMYLVDADSGEIVLRAETNVYGWMNSSSREHSSSGEREGLFGFGRSMFGERGR